ncbi:hypothetical protein NS355_05750 [Sphingomonas yabuuchiae]|uniref:Biopolymer transporter ExbD n=1 Tax=Sphingomonas yabuuchiae TaxID=172044 RepID=A0A147IWD2_9SPHN|nr:hypothetical protein NS355_05750 [Sphingomonas yabuuchiae]
MSLAFALLASAAQVATGSSTDTMDFSHSYVVWIATDRGRCTFFMTDVGEDADQLTETLRQNYNASAGIEILKDSHTPHRCVAKVQKAVKRAGFSMFRVRRGTDADRSPGIP